jgi:parallel beta-helix repeat protein
MLCLILLWMSGASAQTPGRVLYVNNIDTLCNGQAPCFSTIQAAVTAAAAGDTVRIQPGNYAEQVSIRYKNIHADASASDRLVIEADPSVPPGSVVITPPVSSCSTGDAIRIQQSRFVTLRGLTITGAGGEAIRVVGGDKGNQAIHLERNRIFGTGVSVCDSGITVGPGNPQTLIVNNLIYGNTRSGMVFLSGSGGPHFVVNNTVHGNGWTGIAITRYQQVLLINNVVTQNGWASDALENKFGIRRKTGTDVSLTDVHLLHNLVCGNRSGELDGPLLDSTDAGNLTPTGTEGQGVTASPDCDLSTNVYADVSGPDGLMNTADDDFTLMSTSPAIDKGIDPRTVGVQPATASLLADFAYDARRPADGTNSGVPRFDLGALELAAPPAGSQPVVSQPVLVPAVVGLSEADAVAALSAATLTVEVVSQAYSATVPAGQVLSQTPIAGTEVAGGTAVQLVLSAGTTDIDPPSLAITAPGVPVLNEPISMIAVTYVDTGSGIDLTALRILLDGVDITEVCFIWATLAKCEEIGFQEGQHSIAVSIRDMAGNIATTSTQVIQDAIPPRLSLDTPVDGTVTTDGTIHVTGTISDNLDMSGDDGLVRVSVNGMVAQVSNGRFVVEAISLRRGPNTIKAMAVDQAGNTATATITVTFHDLSAPILLSLLAPTDGAVLSSPDVTIHGTIDNITGQETGVTVNGVVALVYEGRFAANHVPLEEGENIITVVATDSAGHTETISITLYRDTSEGYVRLTADAYTGLAPFETVLRLDGPVDITAATITVTDSVNAQVLATTSETEYIVRISAPGLYFLTVEATDYAAYIYTYTVAVLVVDRTTLDTVLQARWDGMKQALANRDIAQAMQYFTDETKGLYQELFTLLFDQLPQLMQEMQSLELIAVEDNAATYRIRRTQPYGGQLLTITYYAYFRPDRYGLWKILRY